MSWPDDPVMTGRPRTGEMLVADELGQSQEYRMLKAAVTATRMPMTITDPHQADNPVVLANPAFLAMTGYPADEVLGRNCRFLQGPDTDRAGVKQIREALCNGREIEIELLTKLPA